MRHLVQKLLVFAAMLFASVSAYASNDYEFQSGGLCYNILSEKDRTVEVTFLTSFNYCGEYDNEAYVSGDIEIPRNLIYQSKTYTVTSIGDKAFMHCRNLTSVKIPNTVTSIGNDAFWYCNGLTSVTIPNSVTSIGNDAFGYCDGLTSVTLSSSLTSIGDKAFSFCSGLTSVTIPNSMTNIGKKAFSYCEGLTSVTIPKSVTTIGEDAFDHCSGLENINVDPKNATYSSIDGVLYNRDATSILLCPEAKKSVTIPNSITSIRDYAFDGCRKLVSMTIPNSVTSIGECAFRECSSLVSMTIPNSVTSIGESVFRGCSSLVSVTIPNSVTSLAHYTFSGCSSLASVTIPNTVTYIGMGAFGGCKSLTSLTLPNSVPSIENYTFTDCSSLASVTIPNTVTYIGMHAFDGCKSLTSVTIPNSVISIWTDAFSNSGLTSVTLPESMTSIGDFVFCECSSLTSVTIPKSMTSIDIDAFRHCNSLEKINVDPENATYSSIDGILYDKDETCLLYCPGGKRLVTIPNSVTSIGNDAFWDCGYLTSVTIPKSLTSIERSTFDDCGNLENINVDPEHPTYLSIDGILYNKDATCLLLCPRAKSSVTIPNSVTSIGEFAFKKCSGLISMTIPNSVTSIGKYAFHHCDSLTSVTIPKSVTSIEICAFEWCDLKAVYVQHEVPLKIRDSVFDNSAYWYATLYVPAGAKEKYKTDKTWKKFWNIEEMDFSGIEDIEEGNSEKPQISINNGVVVVDGIDNGENITIYDMHGHVVSSTTSRVITDLVPGIYIMKVGNHVIKFAI